MSKVFAPIAAALLIAFAGPPAVAHAMLERAAPPVGGVVNPAPTEIVLEFSEEVEAALSRISLANESGETIALGALQNDERDRRVLVAPIATRLVPGTYRVHWRAVSVDSHVSEGDFTFTVAP